MNTFDQAQFEFPDRSWRPTLFWAWNDRLDPRELGRQIQEMRQQGLGGFFMHSRTGLDTPYMSDDWMSAVRTAHDQARRADMNAWLYDEDRWPSGFAAGRVPAQGEAYRMKCLEAHPISLTDVAAHLDDRTTVAVFDIHLDKDGSIVNARRMSIDDSHQRENAVNVDDRRAIVSFRVALGDPGNWQNGESYVDLLNADTTEQFLRFTYDEYAAALEIDEFMPGIFTDEPTIHIYSPHHGLRLPWTTLLPEIFNHDCGYDLLSVLPWLYFQGGNWHKFRYDFWRTVGALFLSSFVKPCFERAEKHGLQFTGHFLYENRFVHQTVSNGSVMPLYEFQHIPGIDQLGPEVRDELTSKQVASVAHQLGRRRIICEIYGASGQGLTFEDQKWAADVLLASGLNMFTKHVALYSMAGERKRDYPPNFNYQQPYWGIFRSINDYLARCSYALALGEPEANVLLLHPIASAWALLGGTLQNPRNRDEIPELDYEAALATFNESEASKNAEIESIEFQFKDLITRLLRAHYDFDLGDEVIMQRHARVEGRQLRVGHATYDVVVVPTSLTWSSSTLALLENFQSAGGKLVLAGDAPTMVDGSGSDAFVNLAMLQRPVMEVLEELALRSVRVFDADSAEIGDVYSHVRVVGSQHIFFLANHSRTDSYSAQVLVRSAEIVHELNPTSGEMRLVETESRGEWTVIRTMFPPAGSRLYVVGTEGGE